MRVLCALAAVLALAVAHHGGAHQKTIPDLFEGQREYVYKYRSLVATGLPRLSQQYAGLEKYGELTVQVQQHQGNTKVLGFRLNNVVSGHFDKEIEDVENRRIDGITHTPEETIGKYGPVFVKYQDNHVQELKTPEGMPEEIINIYRGIAGLFTLTKPGEGEEHPFMSKEGHFVGGQKPVVYRNFEHGITGNCETIYEILSNPLQHHHLNVTKTRNYMKCLGRDPRFHHNGHDAQGCKNVCPDHKPEQLHANMKPETGNWKPVAEGCPVDFHPKKELVEAFTTFNYNMTLERDVAIIRQAQALDKKILPLRKQQIKTVSLIKVDLLEQREVRQPWEQTPATKKYEDITYRFPEGHKFDLEYLSLYNKVEKTEMLKEMIVPMIKRLAEIITSENIEHQGYTGDKIVQITMALGALKKTELQTLWNVIGHGMNQQQRTEIEYVQRKVLLDTMALSGNNDAAELLLELIHQENGLTTLETLHVLEALQKNLVKPTTKIMDGILDVCTNEHFHGKRVIFSTACVTLGELTRTHCGKHQHQVIRGEGEQNLCGRQEIKKYIDGIRQRLFNAKEFAEQAVYIQTLARFSHPEALKALMPIINGEHELINLVKNMNRRDEHEDESEYTQFIRQVAIYALHHSVKEHGPAIQPFVQAIYFNTEEDYEIRIAALSVLLYAQPTEATFGRIVMELGNEEDMEVASYAYSALRSLANATLPCMQQTARRIRNVIAGLPYQTFGIHRSKWVGFTKYMQEANLGLKGQWEVAQSNVSFVPRALFGGFTANKGPFVSTVGNFGMVTKGFENLDKLINQRGGIEKIVEKVMKRVRRNVRDEQVAEPVQKMLDEIESTLRFNPDENREEPRAVFYGSFLGNELYLPVDKEFMTKVAKKAGEQIFDLIREHQKGTEKTFRYVRILLPRTFVQVTPAVNGLPIVLSNRHPIVVSVTLKDLKTRFGTTEEGKLHPITFAVSGLIKPTVYHTSIHSALTINPLVEKREAYGVRAVEKTYVTLPLDAAIQYTHTTKTFGFTLRPRFEKVFYHTTRVMTFKTEALLIREADKPLIQKPTMLKTQEKPFVYDRVLGEKLGMNLRLKGMSMNEQYAVSFLRSRESRQKNPIVALINDLANEWFVPRQWEVRVEKNQQKPIEEVKMVLRFDSLRQQMQGKQPRQLSQEQIRQEEQKYPEQMRMIGYVQQYEQIVGRKPEVEQLDKVLERIVKKTEKYWSQIGAEQLRQQLTKENAQLRSIEYVIAVKGRQEPLAITGHIVVGAPVNKQAKLAEIKMDVQKRPIYLEAQYIAAFTQAPQPFETEVREQEQRGIIGLVAELETRQTGKQQYSAKVEMKKSEEQKSLTKEMKPWYYRQCEEDKKQEMAELSAACEMTRYHKSALNHLRFEIQLPQKNHELLKNATHKIREALKVRLYRNLRANYVAQNQQDKIEGELIYSEKAPEVRMASLIIRTPDNEELRFERLALPKALRPNTMWSIKEQVKAFAKNARPEPACVYNGKNLRTFDNVTISLDEAMEKNQRYVIARDNDEEPKFTILAKKMENEKTTVEILLRNVTLIKLTPPTGQSGYEVQMNSTKVHVSPKKAEIRQYARYNKNMLVAYVEEHKEGQDTLVVKVLDQRMRIVYDGMNVKIVIAKRQQKGQLTGLCGDMNNQHIEELTGPRGCNYEREEDFIRAFALEQGQQAKNRQLVGEWQCPKGVYPRAASQEHIHKHRQEQEKIYKAKEERMSQNMGRRYIDTEGMTYVTKTFAHQNLACFSVEPLRACDEGRRPAETTTERVPFACVHRHMAQELRHEIATKGFVSQSRIINNPSEYVHKEIEIPQRCL